MRGEGTRLAVSRSAASFRAWRSCTFLFHHSRRESLTEGTPWLRPGLAVRDIIAAGKAGRAMTVEEQVLEKLRELPPHRQREVLAFISLLQEKSRHKPRRSLLGLWSDLDVKVSEEDIAEARREMWGSFPRDVS